ncbi:hypothetical protein [Helicobacter sp.]|uniref:hypothetical protein n=1 Tax=Helicobacter sp. TaxID=218 RepID=UPI0025BDECDD|nr:hypothetical protein [Helicobacter sp.]MBR2495373.1 hypothetical protein [Helicobacter sp.]
MKSFCGFFWLFVILCSYMSAKAINVDEILTKSRQFKLITSFSYINLARKDSYLGSIGAQLPDGTHITLPYVGAQSTNQDHLNFSLYMRYGIYRRVEVFSTINAFWQHSGVNDTISSRYIASSRGDFGLWNLGVLIQAKKEGKYPALLLGGSVDLLEQMYFTTTHKTLEYAKGYSFFATSFFTIDPVVFLLQANFRLNLKKESQGLSLDSGESFILNPMVYFAVNPYVSLNAGIKYQYRSSDNVNGTTLAPLGSSLGYTIGIGYEIKPKLILFASADFLPTSQYTSNSLSLMLSYRI